MRVHQKDVALAAAEGGHYADRRHFGRGRRRGFAFLRLFGLRGELRSGEPLVHAALEYLPDAVGQDRIGQFRVRNDLD
jgi:hypothetical protein